MLSFLQNVSTVGLLIGFLLMYVVPIVLIVWIVKQFTKKK